MLTGYARPFDRLTPEEREAAMLGFADSMIWQKRKAFRSFKALATNLFYSMTTGGSPNPNWEVIGYEGPGE